MARLTNTQIDEMVRQVGDIFTSKGEAIVRKYKALAKPIQKKLEKFCGPNKANIYQAKFLICPVRTGYYQTFFTIEIPGVSPGRLVPEADALKRKVYARLSQVNKNALARAWYSGMVSDRKRADTIIECARNLVIDTKDRANLALLNEMERQAVSDLKIVEHECNQLRSDLILAGSGIEVAHLLDDFRNGTYKRKDLVG